MSETLSQQEGESQYQEVESRFGDKEHFCEVLLNGEPKVLGSIDDLKDVSPHVNKVELVNIVNHLQDNEPKNQITPIYFGEENGHSILGVFKPFDGENPYVHEQYGIDRFDVREVLAFQLSEHFGFDLVPPTVHREIAGHLGSLQLYMPESHYQTVDWVEKKSGQSHFDFARESVDWEIMAAFDYILANPDRHARNVMVKYEKNGSKFEIPESEYGAELIAIDNGTSLSTNGYYSRDVIISGPNADMTYSIDDRSPLQLEIPEYLTAMLKQGIKGAKDFDINRFAGVIDEPQLRSVWDRAESLVKTGVFLSRYNERTVFGG